MTTVHVSSNLFCFKQWWAEGAGSLADYNTKFHIMHFNSKRKPRAEFTFTYENDIERGSVVLSIHYSAVKPIEKKEITSFIYSEIRLQSL